MAQIVSQNGHKRTTTLIYDPTQSLADKTAQNISNKKKVAAYARVSTEQDAQQNSYEAQIKYYTNHIQQNPEWNFVKVYADEGISGTSYKNRDGFNEMITDAKAGKINLILTKSISRFARNTVDSLVITRELKKYGVEIFFEKENISSMDTQAELIFTIMSSIAQEESRSISENVRWGISRRMESGQLTVPWKSFLGFERGPDGLPQIVETEAIIVRSIYRDYLDGMGIRQIARKLTASGIKSPRSSNKWSPETIRNILTNEKYKGDAILQKTYTVDFLSKEVRANHGERKQWYISDSHDAIVTPEAFRQVQSELKQRSSCKATRFYPSPFFCKLYCGKCGTCLSHHKWDAHKTHTINGWLCNSCHKKSPQKNDIILTKHQIEKAFLAALQQIATEYEWAPMDYAREFSAATQTQLKDQAKLLNYLKSTPPLFNHFDEHTWHTLVERATIAPNKTMTFKFRNGKKQTIKIN